ncbi:MAG: cyclase family protein [Anaerolineae bacterium]|nr:cyclase family protein [Anaerolineae bacterium]
MPQRIVDLSLTFQPNMRGVVIEPVRTFAKDKLNTNNLQLYSHAGTHMDAPLHFVDRGRTMAHLDLSKCIGPALVIDLSAKTANSFITVEDLAPYACRIGPDARLLLRTDWDQHANQDDYRTDMPRISAGLARWLVDRQIVLLGLETPSVASLRPENKAELIEVHQILLRAEVVIVESLANLRQLQQEVVYFIALPLKIAGGDGSPVRAIALEDEAGF